ncbi:integral membrane sensor-containing signal transduction histidine kinase [Oleiphilus messinensis]|uniref:Integral membrane sensor-containing signal transduction histidine kinase n=1 Tax=Oleiphilus messinensis TaxID=141451 RepID=A0A1Y0ICC5_9GAMM|nr:histidine kinase [Oleiphilus messinensis]ARU58121.1 integral membrane sensor-containing signal transduction histidine kinase [Oleiphilus messinensis]
MPKLKLTVVARASILGGLGSIAWFIAFSRVYILASQDNSETALPLLFLGVANGVFFLANAIWLLHNILINRVSWLTKDDDWVCWSLLFASHGSAFLINHWMDIGPLDQILLSFMIIILSVQFIRFSTFIGVPSIVLVALLYTLQIDHPDRFYIGAYILTQQLVLWSLGYGLFNEINETKRLKVSQAQLKMAQAQLAESSRREERSQIRRDLHDKMGHELAAININLQICEQALLSESDSETPNDSLNNAKSAAQKAYLTLGHVVDELKQQTFEYFYDSLLQIVDKVPKLNIDIDCDPDLRIKDQHKSEQLLCCIQEGITNVLKHSNADKVWIRLFHAGEMLVAEVVDNGSLAQSVNSGNGLTGMQERLALIEGNASYEVKQDRGFKLQLTIPNGDQK